MAILDLESLHSFQLSEKEDAEFARAFPYFYCSYVTGDTSNPEKTLTGRTSAAKMLRWEDFHILRSTLTTYGYHARLACAFFLSAAGTYWLELLSGRKRSLEDLVGNNSSGLFQTLSTRFTAFNLYTKSVSYVEEPAELLYLIDGICPSSPELAVRMEKRILSTRDAEFVDIYGTLKDLHATYKEAIQPNGSAPAYMPRKPIDWLEGTLRVALMVQPLPDYTDFESRLMEDPMFGPKAKFKAILRALRDTPADFFANAKISSPKNTYELCSDYAQEIVGDSESCEVMLNSTIKKVNIDIRKLNEVLEPAFSFVLISLRDVETWIESPSQLPRGWMVVLSDGSRRVMGVRTTVDNHLIEAAKKGLCLAQFGQGLLTASTREEMPGCFFDRISNVHCAFGSQCPHRLLH
jgi:hypothetical protein